MATLATTLPYCDKTVLVQITKVYLVVQVSSLGLTTLLTMLPITHGPSIQAP